MISNSEITQNWIREFQLYCADKQRIFEKVLDLAMLEKVESGIETLQRELPFKPPFKGTPRFYDSWQRLKIKNTHISKMKVI